MLQLRIARLTKPHGLKGGLKVELYTDEPERRLVPGATFNLQVPADSSWHGRTITLRELRWYNTSPVAFFAEIPDRTAAESIAKAILTIDQDETKLPDETDAWYDHQLVDLVVMRNGEAVGTVSRVDHLPGQDILAIQTESDEVLLPFVKHFVSGVDLDERTVTITPPGGLFEPADDGEDEADEVPAQEVADVVAELTAQSAPVSDTAVSDAKAAEKAQNPTSNDDAAPEADRTNHV
ncbi:ribosome maturation factor RimM [Pseudoclavibacter sp. CFCC 11306]|uniref:ribosome maturation factor RimM n=1 Tax=Pseudoclavibacter sp. CFCC 11306 TaxID=1564493 RepID=UPI001300EE6E|nr:ribosome maturation factor RimM [Pseudoclavibacter sp. CFCC 11306]KAB1658638.1 ribosome maturation factor RimM [Pseudoclavibacter sp. CFCC 11306]